MTIPPNPHPEQVEITQADREAAADYAAKIGYPPQAVDNTRDGKCDHLLTVQAFACHRLASLAKRPADDGERPSWRIVGQDSHFGPSVVVDGVPHDQVVLCYWRNQIQPIHLRLPGQAYVADLLRLMAEHQCLEVAIIPVRHAERVSITRAQLEAALPLQPEGVKL